MQHFRDPPGKSLQPLPPQEPQAASQQPMPFALVPSIPGMPLPQVVEPVKRRIGEARRTRGGEHGLGNILAK